MKFTFCINIARKKPLRTHPRFTNRKRLSTLRRVKRYWQSGSRREQIKSYSGNQLILAR